MAARGGEALPLNRSQEMDHNGKRHRMPIEMEVQDVLGSLKPIPFAQVVQSMDFVEQPFGQTEGIPPKKRKKSHSVVKPEDPVFIDVSSGDASNFVETILNDPPSKIPRQHVGGRAQQANTGRPTVVRYNLPDGWHKTVVSRATQDGEVIEVYLVPPGLTKKGLLKKLSTSHELIR